MAGELYKVEEKREIRRLAKGGDVEVAYTIYATSKGGTYFSVEVPEKELSRSADLLAAKAKLLDSI